MPYVVFQDSLTFTNPFVLQNFVIDNTTCSQPGVFDGENATLLNEVVCEHLLRQGRLDIAEQLIEVRSKWSLIRIAQ